MQNYLGVFNFEFCIVNCEFATSTEVASPEPGASAVAPHPQMYNNAECKMHNAKLFCSLFLHGEDR